VLGSWVAQSLGWFPFDHEFGNRLRWQRKGPIALVHNPCQPALCLFWCWWGAEVGISKKCLLSCSWVRWNKRQEDLPISVTQLVPAWGDCKEIQQCYPWPYCLPHGILQGDAWFWDSGIDSSSISVMMMPYDYLIQNLMRSYSMTHPHACQRRIVVAAPVWILDAVEQLFLGRIELERE
jgi:hypothetical protein